MSFTQGFSTGFGLVDGTMRNARAEERQKMLDAREQQRYQQEQQYRKQQAEKAQANADRSFGLQQDQFRMQRQDAQWNQDNAMFDREDAADQREYQRKREKLADGMAIKEHSAKMNKYQVETMDARNKLAASYLEDYARSGQISDEAARVIADSSFAGTYNAMSGIKDTLTGVLNGYEKIKTPDELVQFINQKDTLEVVNRSMRNELYRREKSTGNTYEIIALEPMPGGVTPVFKITDEDGNVVAQRAPATKNQSPDKNDEVMVVPISQLKNKIAEGFRFMDYADRDPVLKSVLQSKSTDGKWKRLNNNTIYNDKTSEHKQIKQSGISQEDIDKAYAKYVEYNSRLAIKGQKLMTKSEYQSKIIGGPTAVDKIEATLKKRAQAMQQSQTAP